MFIRSILSRYMLIKKQIFGSQGSVNEHETSVIKCGEKKVASPAENFLRLNFTTTVRCNLEDILFL